MRCTQTVSEVTSLLGNTKSAGPEGIDSSVTDMAVPEAAIHPREEAANIGPATQTLGIPAAPEVPTLAGEGS